MFNLLTNLPSQGPHLVSL